MEPPPSPSYKFEEEEWGKEKLKEEEWEKGKLKEEEGEESPPTHP